MTMKVPENLFLFFLYPSQPWISSSSAPPSPFLCTPTWSWPVFPLSAMKGYWNWSLHSTTAPRLPYILTACRWTIWKSARGLLACSAYYRGWRVAHDSALFWWAAIFFWRLGLSRCSGRDPGILFFLFSARQEFFLWAASLF